MKKQNKPFIQSRFFHATPSRGYRLGEHNNPTEDALVVGAAAFVAAGGLIIGGSALGIFGLGYGIGYYRGKNSQINKSDSVNNDNRSRL